MNILAWVQVPPLRSSRIPLAIKLLHTGFLCILIPVYWANYGPANFLWFSDIALFGMFFALWLENPFLASMQAVSVTLLESLWLVDFLGRLLLGVKVIGLSEYMFDPAIPLFVRGLSLFHVWLPILLPWSVWRLGYDRRALIAQTLLAWFILPLCYFITNPAKNINWVFAPGGAKPQEWMPPGLYLIVVMLMFPLCNYLPAHLILRKLAPKAPR